MNTSPTPHAAPLRSSVLLIALLLLSGAAPLLAGAPALAEDAAGPRGVEPEPGTEARCEPPPGVRVVDGVASPCERYRVDAIIVEGLSRTQRYVIERELIFGEGDVATRIEVEESVQRLRNTGLFRKVDWELVDRRIAQGPVFEGPGAPRADDAEPSYPRAAAPAPRVLRIVVDERWTLLPNFRFGRGGETLYLMLGLSDANLLGHYLQVGGLYERLGPANSFSVWFRNPRLFGDRLTLATDLAHTNRTVTLYEPSGAIEGGYLITRQSVATQLEKEWRWWWRTAVSVGFTRDDFSYTLISDRVRDAQEGHGGLPGSESAIALSLSSRLGRLDYDNYLVDGTTLALRLSRNLTLWELEGQYTRLDATLLHFATLPLDSTLAVRLGGGASDALLPHQMYFSGGLDTVRGFLNQRFRGTFYWVGNVEYRIPSLDTRWLTLQHVVFVDSVGMAESASGMFGLSGASAGLGIRIISPKIYGFNVRIDYAFPLTGNGGSGLSFGGGQFF